MELNEHVTLFMPCHTARIQCMGSPDYQSLQNKWSPEIEVTTNVWQQCVDKSGFTLGIIPSSVCSFHCYLPGAVPFLNKYIHNYAYIYIYIYIYIHM